jgi:hypothetical protein
MDMTMNFFLQCSVFVVEHKNEKVLLVMVRSGGLEIFVSTWFAHTYGMRWARGVAAEQEDGALLDMLDS